MGERNGTLGVLRNLLECRAESADNHRVKIQHPASPRGVAALILLAACVALAVTGFGLLIASRTIAKQASTQSWTPTPARVISTTPFRASGLLRARPMTYEYTVGTKSYVSDRYCYGVGILSRSRGERYRIIWTPGTRPTVFVNPRDSTEAVLENQLHGYHLLPLPGVLPFGMLTIACGIAGVRWLQRKNHRVAGGLLLSDRGGLARIELRPVYPKWGIVSGSFVVWLLVMAILVYGFDFDPPIWAVLIGCVMTLGGGLARYLWLVAIRTRGEGALAIDRARRELRLPVDLAEFHGKPTLRFDDVDAIEAHDAGELGDSTEEGRYVVKIRPHGCNHTRSLAVRRTDNFVEAHDLAHWLRKQLGVQAMQGEVKPQ